MDENTQKKVIKKIRKPFYKVVFSRFFIIMVILMLQIALLMVIFFRLQTHSRQFMGLYMLVGFVAVVWIMNSHNNPTYKLSWAIIVAFLPVMGTLMYMYTHGTLGSVLPQLQMQESIREMQGYTYTSPDVKQQVVLEDRDFVKTATYLEASGYPTFRNTTVKYYPLGDYVMNDLLEELQKAESFIFMEFFIVSEGYFWDRVLEILERKRDEGVEIRFIYDDMGSATTLPRNYYKKLTLQGIITKPFARLTPFLSTAYNNRDHRKIVVVDGKVAFSGGFNLADEYINRVERFGHWKDEGFMIRGDAVRSYTMLFLQMWNATERGEHEDPARYLNVPVDHEAGSEAGFIIPYGDGPFRKASVAENVYLDVINSAVDHVHIMTPYLIPDNEMLHALKHAARSGVEVSMILPGIPDKKIINLLAKSYYRELTEAGVRIYEYAPGFIHSKVMEADGRVAVVGTVNLDFRSLDLHYECASMIYNDPAVRSVSDDFNETLKVCRLINDDDMKRFGFILMVISGMLRLFAPLL